MSVLRSLEAKLEGLVEGAFSRAFKSQVQPVELAHKLAKEMQEHRVVSVSRVYVPNEYVLFLSPADREQFAGYEGALQKELSDYLLENARAEGLSLVTRPSIEFRTDERLKLGEFGIQAQLVRPPLDDSDGVEQAEFGHTMVYSPDRDPQPLAAPPPRGRTVLVSDGKRFPLRGERLLLGRSKDCDVVLDDPNVSRRHAELARDEQGWTIRDLGSTNGIKLNGQRVHEGAVTPGDEIALGLTRLTLEVE